MSRRRKSNIFTPTGSPYVKRKLEAELAAAVKSSMPSDSTKAVTKAVTSAVTNVVTNVVTRAVRDIIAVRGMREIHQKDGSTLKLTDFSEIQRNGIRNLARRMNVGFYAATKAVIERGIESWSTNT